MNRKDDEGDWADEVVDIPIDGVLDLHTFRPDEVKNLVPDYIECCLAEGITEIRIIHGKGTGVLRELVRKILDRHPSVIKYGTPSDASSWGATVAELGPTNEKDPQ
jgi:dsDNA-specific endonuclease/ATPase MutS2